MFVTPDPLALFSLPVREWFRNAFGEPTPPQAQGWLPIQRGEHTLILAPTGSGKTLAAFLWGIDQLFRHVGKASPERSRRVAKHVLSEAEGLSNIKPQRGIHLLYISPLKALNNDIERNLRVPLEGIRDTAARMGEHLPALRVAVRTGDTPAHARAAMLKQPPHILITTPESLFLMLTSPRARDLFQTVRTVIVDEIHTLVGNKRGTHLSLSLERLEHLATDHVQRIGLSATIKPLEEAARFLGGREQSPASNLQSPDQSLNLSVSYSPRPVTIVNATYHKALDLRVVTVVDDFSSLPGETIWPYVVPQVLNDIRRHTSTLIFCNNRRLAERTADRLNAQLDAEQKEEIEPGSPEAIAPGGIARDRGIFAIGAQGPIRAHHGSMSKQARRRMEEDLKAGKLPALVGTSSLELGIDIGAVDLVVQLQSPKSVAQGLQRIGRSGHLVGQTSVGRIYATFREDLVEAAAIVRGMFEGDVEPTYSPENPLDVLAQQIVAMVACEEWDVSAMYDLVRRAYPYRDLTERAFESVLEMLSGKYGSAGATPETPQLRARISWDRVNQRLLALPGSRLVAMLNAGTISDTGAFGVYLGDGKTKVGELDEEFVFETHSGDVFLLGSHVWRVQEITDDRVIVGDASGATPRMPFWNGDYPYRPFELGARIGMFRREVAERIAASRDAPHEIAEWLERDYHLDKNSALCLIAYVQRQLDAVGVMSSDQTIVVETFQDAVGEPRMVLHSPFGGRVNGAWALALTSLLKERVGINIETQIDDDGILFRFPATSDPPAELVMNLTPQDARERILRELPNSALFGAHFRMNAARSLLLPKARGKKRTPFWLQRLKAKDLLARVRKFDDFPIVAETYRDCLRDVLDLPHLEEILGKIQAGEIRIAPIETIVPSPVAAGLLYQFISVYMYEWDAPKAERQLQTLAARRELVDDLLQGVELQDLLKPEAVQEVLARLQHTAEGYQARSAEELALFFDELGDLTTDEIRARCVGDATAWLAQLAAQKRIFETSVPTQRGEENRWVLAESPLSPLQRGEKGGITTDDATLRRFLFHSGPVTRDDILDRYAFDPAWLDETLAHLVAIREIVEGQFTQSLNPSVPQSLNSSISQFCSRHLLEQFHRHTLTILRKEVQPVSLYAYADFLARWQHVHPRERLRGTDGLRATLEQLRGAVFSESVWEREILPARIADFDAEDLNALCASGELVWVAQKSRLRFFFRGEGGLFLGASEESGRLPGTASRQAQHEGAALTKLSADASAVYEFLKSEGASFIGDVESSLRLKPDTISRALSELTLAGYVTNDTLEAFRAAAGTNRASADEGLSRRGIKSAVELELATRLQRPRVLTTSRYRDAKRRVAKRLRSDEPALEWTGGRWSVVHRVGILGPAMTDEERAEKLARVLLSRYGVVTRESLEREDLPVDWFMLYSVFQRMEMRGEIRRGYFVQGLAGVQFALPDAVEKLRALADDTLIVLNATDPANIFGGELADAPRFARVASTQAVFWHGQPVLVAEENGERITMQEVEREIVSRALQAYQSRPNAPRHTVIKQWNGVSVLGSSIEPILQSLGFYRTPKGMEV